MIIAWLMLIVVGLVIYAAFLKFAARLLRYSVSWKISFLFAAIMLSAVIIHHVLLFSSPVPIRIGLGVVLLLGLLILGGWFLSGRGTDRHGAALAWSDGTRLIALMFAMILVLVFAIAMPIHVFLTNHLSAQ